MSGSFPAVDSSGNSITIVSKDYDGQDLLLTADDDSVYEADTLDRTSPFAHPNVGLLRTVAGKPGAPTAVEATGGVTEIVVEWVAPASDGGSAITSYTAVAYDDEDEVAGTEETADGVTLTATITGLAAGNYYVQVFAENAQGSGPESAPSEVVAVTAA